MPISGGRHDGRPVHCGHLVGAGGATTAGGMTAGVDTRTVLGVRNLRAWIGSQEILHGVDFDVPAYGVTALLGRNGVGKTTTLRAVLGLVRRTGTVRLGDAEVGAEATHQIVRRGVGYVPENREVFGGLSVAENLRLARRKGAEDRTDLVATLFPDLVARADQAAGTLSGGQQQMVALARALLNDNRLLLVDEPTKGLAPQVVDEVADALAEAATTVPVLLVEQDLAVVERLATKVVVMAEGRVRHEGTAGEFLADRDLVRSLLGVGR
jgi:branched-chain amino acid transport system ATP-binding protein